jgi:hypothetical protein
MNEDWEIWYYNFIFLVMPEEMALEYWNMREILKDFQRLDGPDDGQND